MNSKFKIFEISAVIATSISKFIFMDWLNLKFAFIVVACLFWIFYVIYRNNKDKGILKYWGFSKNNLFKTFRVLIPIALFCITGFIIYGNVKNVMIVNWHIIPILLLYPIWGLIQQFLVVGLVAGNLIEVEALKNKKTLVIILTSFLFSIIHLHSIYLLIATFFLSLFYVTLYLKWRNLWPLGLFHGLLGGLFFFFVIGEDPWVILFSELNIF